MEDHKIQLVNDFTLRQKVGVEPARFLWNHGTASTGGVRIEDHEFPTTMEPPLTSGRTKGHYGSIHRDWGARA